MGSNSEPLLSVEISSDTRLSGEVKGPVVDELRQKLIIPNPIYEDKQRRGYYTGNIPQYLTFITQKNGKWIMPRGFTKKLVDILRKHRCAFVLDLNGTRELKSIDFSFHGNLQPEQVEAANTILKKYFSLAQLPTGAGKTVVALVCISARKQPALVIVHTKELLYQWREASKKFLKLKDDEIGLLGDGHKKVGKKLTIAIINTLQKMMPEVIDKIGFLVVDECHRVPSTIFSETVSMFDCRYMLGLTATPHRTDGLTDLIHLYLGELIFKEGAKEAQEKGIIMQPSVWVTHTNFDYPYNNSYPQLISALIRDPARNNIIVRGIVSAATSHTTLVVSDRTEHCIALARLLRKYDILNTEVLTGNVSKRKRKQIIKAVNAGKVDILIATTSLIGEGFDCKNLSALVLATPIKSKTKLEQVVGRVRRVDRDKSQPVVKDYLDKPGVLRASYISRYHAYLEMGAKLWGPPINTIFLDG
jgi:superfamily II DNA or RNA helicase